MGWNPMNGNKRYLRERFFCSLYRWLANAVVFCNEVVVKEISAPTGDLSNNHAELYAILLALRWAVQSDICQRENGQRAFHIVTDSKYAICVLCNTKIQKKTSILFRRLLTTQTYSHSSLKFPFIGFHPILTSSPVGN